MRLRPQMTRKYTIFRCKILSKSSTIRKSLWGSTIQKTRPIYLRIVQTNWSPFLSIKKLKIWRNLRTTLGYFCLIQFFCRCPRLHVREYQSWTETKNTIKLPSRHRDQRRQRRFQIFCKKIWQKYRRISWSCQHLCWGTCLYCWSPDQLKDKQLHPWLSGRGNQNKMEWTGRKIKILEWKDDRRYSASDECIQ